LEKTEAKRRFGFFTYMNRQYTQNYLHNLKGQKIAIPMHVKPFLTGYIEES
jgi:hypothetical protein